ncbi:MAG: hypothetical protein JO086_15180 [Acidimicrobiia bacterium]|nr:hypothetical protein [Acidimicrobiia bacterium]
MTHGLMTSVLDRLRARGRRLRRLALTASAWHLLPEEIRTAAQHVPILVRDKPTDREIAEYGIPAAVSGVFVDAGDVDQDAEGPAGAAAPRTGVIVLYLDNIDPCTAEGIAGVLLHEASHALGLDDHHLEELGL